MPKAKTEARGPVVYSFLNPPPSCPYAFPDRRIRKRHRETVGDDGLKRLVVAETYDAYAEVQAYAETVDIYAILERCGRGDFSALHSRPIQYGDITEVPTDLASLLDVGRRTRELFDSLDESVRAFYKNDYNFFLAHAESDILRSRIETAQKVRAEESEREQKNDDGGAE